MGLYLHVSTGFFKEKYFQGGQTNVLKNRGGSLVGAKIHIN